MSKLKVGIVTSMVPSCDLYRSQGPGDALAAQGEIELVELPGEVRMRMAKRAYGHDEPVGFTNMPDMDVIVFIRGVLPARIVALIPLFQARGTACVVDVDDDYQHLPSMLQDLYKINPRQNPLYSWANVKEACKLADLVTVSTDPLRSYARGSVVLKNCVPRRYLEIEAERDGKTVGWAGVTAGHPGDLRMCRSGVAEAIAETGGHFLNVGDGIDIQEQLGLHEEPEVTGIVPLEEYPTHVARFDIGIAPLELTRYSAAKSYLKYLESLSLGSAVVASDAPEYIDLQAQLDLWCHDNASPVPGAVVSSRRREWYREVLKRLQWSEERRTEASEAARAFVREKHMLESNAWRWGEAWQLAYDIRHA